MSLNRRQILQGTAAVLATPFIARPAFAGSSIQVASIFDLSGGLEIYGQPIDSCLDLAIDEINQSGGLLGQQIEVAKYDPQSSIQLYTQYSTEAATAKKASVVFGGITSASREAIRPLLSRYRTLYFYPPLYEGGVCDRNTFCTGSTPAQTIGVLLPYAVQNMGKKVYVLAADYNYGTISAKWVREYAGKAGGEVIAEEYFPLDVTDFSATIQKIQAAKPDVIYTLLVGGNHMSFFRQWAAAGMAGQIPIISTSFGGGNEHIVLSPAEADGVHAAFGYFQEVDSPINKAFLDRYHGKFGPDAPYVTEHASATYNAVHHWASAVRKAGSTDRLAVIEALETGIPFDGPGGQSVIDPSTHHCATDVHIGRVKNHSFEIIETFAKQQPSDTAAVCDLIKNPDETRQFEI
ncbi:transporter substrate-binding protein [Paracoccus sp. MBLB3053]|uniref:Transporter substrate-binding protein n=1 Tax=Paracoccus aurantius TaxID=3073814 RepID=A0ABU2HTV8_9RHOB|nr:ABC transporter substrate-binding protein [Paracoccus sp. MBLB3053]MDS9468487.1 transporter substrate-binding protein [Paracoccus sp. MBLB3053]